MVLMVASSSGVFTLAPGGAELRASDDLAGLWAACLAADPDTPGRVWCGTRERGVFRSDDTGSSWQPAGLDGRRVTALAASSAGGGGVWAGTEPSEVWRWDPGNGWSPTAQLDTLPSSYEWSFPPRPHTHHVRWIAEHPRRPGRLWVAVEAGALVTTEDRGRSWRDRVDGGPRDTHELAIHPDRPDTLRVAAGDGYFESHDGGRSWERPREGLDVGYLRSLAVDPGDPDAVVVAASSGPRSAYVAGEADGRVYRRAGDRWERILEGWPEPPDGIAPVLLSGREPGEIWAADHRGVHRSDDAGATWRAVAAFPAPTRSVRALALVAER